ncbi:MAG: hydrolase [Oscillospiraceae bacterium]|nr:hydrolase [Oscillospiraceae bacterium]
MDKETQKNLSDDFVKLLRFTGRDGIEELIRYLQEETDFFTAPASTKYHGAFEGGLLKHSMNVLDCLDEAGYDYKTVIVVALLHDICKANCYGKETRNVKENGAWVEKQVYTYQDDLPLGHGEKSLYIISKYIKLTDEEAAAIRWHMGGFDSAFRGGDRGLNIAFEKYPLAVLLHLADMKATYIVERGYGND